MSGLKCLEKQIKKEPTMVVMAPDHNSPLSVQYWISRLKARILCADLEWLDNRDGFISVPDLIT